MENNPIFDIPDPNKEYQCSIYSKSTGFTLLMKLVMQARKEGVMDYLKSYISTLTKEELDKKNTYGWTALMLTARNSNIYSNVDVLQMLLENGANPNLRDNYGDTALIWASSYSNTDSNIETVKILLENGANPNLQCNNGYTALMIASSYSNTDSNIETVKILLENGANPNLQNNNGFTALSLLPQVKDTKLIKEFVRYGADPKYLKNNNKEIYRKYKSYLQKKEIKVLKEKLNFYEETLKYHPDGKIIKELEKEFFSKNKK